jgi:putative protease
MKPELLSPAGDFETLNAAIKAGADSVYFGVGKLNMRSRSANFKEQDLKQVAETCKKHNIKSYLTINTILYDQDLKAAKELCDRAKAAGISAIIASDISIIQYAKEINLEVHISTQTNVSNIEAVKFFARYADVIVLARETLPQIKEITTEIKNQDIKGPNNKPVKIELFIHGAMCVSIAGKCYMSLALYNESANRGECLQACRRQYQVKDQETGDELIVDNQYIMSPKDLCTIGMIDRLIQANIQVFKIEGRARSPEYVYTTTKVYREAIDSIESNTYTKENIEKWKTQLKTVFNRGFWEDGYYLGKKLGEWSGVYGSKATEEKIQLGKVLNYYAKNNIAHILIEANQIQAGDKLLITGPTTGAVYTIAESIFKDDEQAIEANKGDEITIPVPETVRKNDKVFLIKPRESR